MAIVRAFPTAPLHYRALQIAMNSVLPASHTQEDIEKKYNSLIRINAESKGDLVWWKVLDRTTVNTPILQSNPSEVIELDASSRGWGALLNSQTCTGGVWSVQEMTRHINYLEMLAAF